MTADKRWPGASEAGWSQAGPRRGEDDAAEFAPAHERYEPCGVIGAGGMGTVVRSRDRRLMREVALKEVRPDRPRELLVREARLTARLEHPNIVPIYDAGTSASGDPFYTMRLVHGRSLAQVFADCGSVTERLAFLRHYQNVCEAVAFAHSRGVVHCDLKPANIMVGDFGETQVVDWGLAVFVDSGGERAPGAPIDDLPEPPARAGTPSYMSPEQRAGAPPGVHFDVWSLGAILHEFLTGAPPEHEPRAEQPGHFELRAICRKALAPRSGDRYASASELASDISRHLEGRRVAAHTYRPLELLGHVARAWRVPLTVALIAAVVLVAVLTTSWFRVASERRRAQGAEATAYAALRSSSESLAWALSQQAVAALDKGQLAEAEVLAASALKQSEQPDARGVIAAVNAWTRPRAAWSVGGPHCRKVYPDATGGAVCVTGHGLELWTRRPDESSLSLEWEQPIRPVSVAILADIVAIATGTRVLGLSKATGQPVWSVASDDHTLSADVSAGRIISADNNRVSAYEGTTGRKLGTVRPCARAAMIRAVGGDGGATGLVCLDGQVRVVDQNTGVSVWRPGAPQPSVQNPGTAIAVSAGGDIVAVGDVVGGVIVYDQKRDAPLELRRPTNTPIAELRFLTDQRLLVIPEQRGPELWNLAGESHVLTLPRDTRSVSGAGRWLVGAGRRLTAWSLPPRFEIGRFEGSAGLSSAALDGEANLVAAGRGDGSVVVWQRHGERPAHIARLSRHVVKRVEFAEGGNSLIAATADTSGGARLSGPGFNEMQTGLAGRSCRRVSILDEDLAVFVHYGSGLIAMRPDSARSTLVDGPPFIDIDATADRKRAVLVAADGDVYQFDARSGLRALLTAADTTAAAQATAGTVATVAPDGVRIYSPDGALIRRFESGLGGLLDVAISSDGRLVAAASRTGVVEVWDAAGSLRARLSGHRERVAFVKFYERTLVSAGWDGAVQLWDLSTLDATPDALLRDSRAAWGLDLQSLSGSPNLRPQR